jgi:hypothetical protein
MKTTRASLRIALSLFVMACAEPSFADPVVLTNLTITAIAVDTTGVNKIISVSPSHTECYAVGYSNLLFNDTGENAQMAYAALLAAFAAGKQIEVTHDGTGYCKITRVKVLD